MKLVQMDDWQALYDDEGDKILEGHTIPTRDLLEALGVTLSIVWVTDDYYEETAVYGGVPEKLSEYPEGALDE
jgi:hypothetical protein